MTSRLKIEDIRNYYGKNINTQEFSELLGLNEKTVKRYISDSILPVAEHHELLGKLLDAEKCHKILVNNDRNNSFTDKNITKRRENYGYITSSQCRALLLIPGAKQFVSSLMMYLPLQLPPLSLLHRGAGTCGEAVNPCPHWIALRNQSLCKCLADRSQESHRWRRLSFRRPGRWHHSPRRRAYRL